jgi:hypothetical protein
MELCLCNIRAYMGRRESLRWLVLLRASVGHFIGEFMDGKGYPQLTKADRLNVFRMLTIASIEYGLKANYFATFGSKSEHIGRVSDILDKIPAIPDEEICALRGLVDRAVMLHTFEKAFRLVGRGAAFSFQPSGKLILAIPSPVVSGLDFYDMRVSAQYASRQYLVGSGFPGIMESVELNDDTLFFVGQLPSESWQNAMEAIRANSPPRKSISGGFHAATRPT